MKKKKKTAISKQGPKKSSQAKLTPSALVALVAGSVMIGSGLYAAIWLQGYAGLYFSGLGAVVLFLVFFSLR